MQHNIHSQIPADRWVQRGLSCALMLGGVIYDRASNRHSEIVGAKLRGNAAGPARGFGATLGVGTSDRVHTWLAHQPLTRSYVFAATPNGAGGNSAGRIFERDERSGTQTEYLYRDNTNASWQYFRNRTAYGNWRTPNNSAVLGTSVVVGMSVDHSSHLNVPVFSINGATVATTTVSAPTGTLTLLATGPRYLIGNRGDSARAFDGIINRFYAFDIDLTSMELNELTFNPDALWASRKIFMLGTAVSTGASNAPRVHHRHLQMRN